MALHRLSNESGLQVAPSQEADELIFSHLSKLAMPAGFPDDAFFVADRVADMGFQTGWFYDELSDDKIDELVQYVRTEADIPLPDNQEYSDFFKNIAERAILTGSHAFTMTQLDNLTVKG